MDNSSPTWAAYCTIITFRLVPLDKIPWLHHVRIRETLLRDLAKLGMRAEWYQVKTACGNFQL